MTQAANNNAYGVLSDDSTLTVKRLLPGPIDRVWRYLAESDLRRQWLAAGDMEMKRGSRFELVWRNGELMDNPGQPPEGFGGEHRMNSEITEIDAPRKLSFSWGDTGGVSFELDQQGDEVLLTLTHRRIAERSTRLNISAGWHAHLDVLAARLSGDELTRPFWDHWASLKADYEKRLPA
ncbi:MAG: SRPBCC family protein [Sphingomicrobium sp.]